MSRGVVWSSDEIFHSLSAQSHVYIIYIYVALNTYAASILMCIFLDRQLRLRTYCKHICAKSSSGKRPTLLPSVNYRVDCPVFLMFARV